MDGPMRDPFQWAFPLFRAFGIPIRIHITLIVFSSGMFLRQIGQPGGGDKILEIFLLTIPIFFGLLLLHEFGHCFAGRMVDGEPTEIVLWPLGGLAFIDVPKNWRAHTITAAGGPMVNVVVCVVTSVFLAGYGFIPTWNPFGDPYVSEMRNYRDQKVYTSEFGIRLYEPGTSEPAALPEELKSKLNVPAEAHDAVVKSGKDRAVAPLFLVWANRIFWLSWVLLLLTMLPGYPLDGGQLLQGFVWSKTDEEQGITTACWAGYVVAVVLLIASLAANEVWPMALAGFIAIACWFKLNRNALPERGGGEYETGYNLTDPDDDAPPARPKKKQSLMKQWLTARTARRMQRDLEQQQQEDERLDQLLEKIARKEKLTAEEEAFMKRVSTRYKNR